MPIRNAPLVNYYNLKYVGPIYMGQNRESVNVIWDTGSSVFLAETHACTDCHAPVYNYADEIGGSFTLTDDYYSESYLDGTRLSGHWATDTVCVLNDANTCVSNFKWVAVNEAEEMDEEEDGIIGMS